MFNFPRSSRTTPIAELVESDPDQTLAILWPDVGEILYDLTVVHTCCSSYRKQSSNDLLQSAQDRKNNKYVKEKGLDPESFRCIAITDCGVLHEETKQLLKTLAKRAGLDYTPTREAFQLELEKYSAYAVVSQLRQYIQAEKWVGGLRL